MQIGTRSAGAIVAGLLAIVLWAVPAEATVHEIVAQWCSGREPLEPHGLSRPGSRNFAQPLMATGFIGDVVFVPELGGLLIQFNYDVQAAKVVGTGEFFQVAQLPDGTPIFIEGVQPDPDFPAFQRCPRLASLSH